MTTDEKEGRVGLHKRSNFGLTGDFTLDWNSRGTKVKKILKVTGILFQFQGIN